MKGETPRLILASGSPRRQELLAHLGLPFEVAPAAVDEGDFSGDPAQAVVEAARRKARAVAEIVSDPSALVVGADTVVVSGDGRVLGKPADAADARRMLRGLRDGWHQVITGLVVLRDNQEWTDAVATRVHMRPYTDAEIEAYIARGEPFDKAGAYAIQDPAFDPADAVEGCAMTVVGLPLCALYRLLVAAGASPVDPHSICQECETSNVKTSNVMPDA
jgi:MAF protein